jgi:hypothetical protein
LCLHYLKQLSPLDFNGPYYLSIAGNLLQSHDSFDVINLATGQAFAKAPSATAEQLHETVAAASHAFKAWPALGYDGRQKYLNAYADALEVHRDELSRLLPLEQGKLLKTMAERGCAAPPHNQKKEQGKTRHFYVAGHTTFELSEDRSDLSISCARRSRRRTDIPLKRKAIHSLRGPSVRWTICWVRHYSDKEPPAQA